MHVFQKTKHWRWNMSLWLYLGPTDYGTNFSLSVGPYSMNVPTGKAKPSRKEKGADNGQHTMGG